MSPVHFVSVTCDYLCMYISVCYKCNSVNSVLNLFIAIYVVSVLCALVQYCMYCMCSPFLMGEQNHAKCSGAEQSSKVIYNNTIINIGYYKETLTKLTTFF